MPTNDSPAARLLALCSTPAHRDVLRATATLLARARGVASVDLADPELPALVKRAIESHDATEDAGEGPYDPLRDACSEESIELRNHYAAVDRQAREDAEMGTW